MARPERVHLSCLFAQETFRCDAFLLVFSVPNKGTAWERRIAGNFNQTVGRRDDTRLRKLIAA